MGLQLRKTLSGRTVGLSSLSVGKVLTLGCAPCPCMGNLMQNVFSERTLF